MDAPWKSRKFRLEIARRKTSKKDGIYRRRSWVRLNVYNCNECLVLKKDGHRRSFCGRGGGHVPLVKQWTQFRRNRKKRGRRGNMIKKGLEIPSSLLNLNSFHLVRLLPPPPLPDDAGAYSVPTHATLLWESQLKSSKAQLVKNEFW